jgi:hypothetical protein
MHRSTFEAISKLQKNVTPAEAGVQKKSLNSGFRLPPE